MISKRQSLVNNNCDKFYVKTGHDNPFEFCMMKNEHVKEMLQEKIG